jgi:hypothetical protein
MQMREELRAKGALAEDPLDNVNEVDNDYDFTDLPDDGEAEDAATE